LLCSVKSGRRIRKAVAGFGLADKYFYGDKYAFFLTNKLAFIFNLFSV